MARTQQSKNQGSFPPGGLTPVYNEVKVWLAITPERPAPEAKLADIDGPCEEILMQNIIDETTGLVRPTVFYRSETFTDSRTGLNTQILALGVDSGIARSKLFGGELTMHVRPPMNLPELPEEERAAFSATALADLQVSPSDAVVPGRHSIGQIQALTHESDFPARVTVPVHYTFESGGRDRELATVGDNYSREAIEPHLMQAVVTSIPPDPGTPIRATEWNLIDESTYLKLWIFVEAFRFLEPADYKRKVRLTYRNGSLVSEKTKRSTR